MTNKHLKNKTKQSKNESFIKSDLQKTIPVPVAKKISALEYYENLQNDDTPILQKLDYLENIFCSLPESDERTRYEVYTQSDFLKYKADDGRVIITLLQIDVDDEECCVILLVQLMKGNKEVKALIIKRVAKMTLLNSNNE